MSIWHETVKVGDVVEWPSGNLRIVREVWRNPIPKRPRCNYNPARKVFVIFAIQHCSWTKRPYTQYSIGELEQIGAHPTGINYKLNSGFDRALQGDFHASRSEDCKFRCCDVKGLP